MPDRFLPRRRLVDRLQRDRDLDELLADRMGHKLAWDSKISGLRLGNDHLDPEPYTRNFPPDEKLFRKAQMPIPDSIHRANRRDPSARTIAESRSVDAGDTRYNFQ